MHIRTSIFPGLHTLKQRLYIWIGFIVVFLGLSIVGSFYFEEQHHREMEAGKQLQQTLSLQRLFIERWTADRSAQIRSIARQLSGSVVDKSNRGNLFSAFLSSQDEFSSVVFVNADGIVESGVNTTYGIDVSTREYFKAAREGKEYVSNVLIGKNTGNPIIVFSCPVNGSGGLFQGLVFGAVRLDTVSRMMEQFRFGETGETYLIDSAGHFITKPRTLDSAEPLAMSNTSAIYQRAASGSDEMEPYLNFAGQTVLGQFQWTKDKRWIVVGEMNRQEVLAPVYRRVLLMIGIVVSVLIISIFVVLWLTKRMERPIRCLLKGTKIMQTGNYDYRIGEEEFRSAPSELQQLCHLFNSTAGTLKKTIEMLEKTAVIDQLTKLYNRRFIINSGNRLLETCIRAAQPCSLLMIDIDFFKKVNDTYGHLVGDRVLIHTASVLQSTIRTCDLLARFGGEEFLVLAPNTEACKGGLQLAERIRKTYEELLYREEGIEIKLTVSIGVTDYPADIPYGTKVLEEMISRADEALYEAKKSGRNRAACS